MCGLSMSEGLRTGTGISTTGLRNGEVLPDDFEGAGAAFLGGGASIFSSSISSSTSSESSSITVGTTGLDTTGLLTLRFELEPRRLDRSSLSSISIASSSSVSGSSSALALLRVRRRGGSREFCLPDLPLLEIGLEDAAADKLCMEAALREPANPPFSTGSAESLLEDLDAGKPDWREGGTRGFLGLDLGLSEEGRRPSSMPTLLARTLSASLRRRGA